MSYPELPEIILNSIQSNYRKLRICSFTIKNENLLFWSHYAQSHEGFCIEFDAAKRPINCAQKKVQYKDNFPEVVFPMPDNATGFIPALTKSKDWEYEDEYRVIFHPEAETPFENDGSSVLLKGNEIINVYFGANMPDTNKTRLVDIINKGIFSPGIWNSYLSKSFYKLEFNECN